MPNKSLKCLLKEGGVSVGSWLSLGHPGIAEIMARSGFDWVAIDLEHSAISITETENLIRTLALCGTKPFVRVTSNDANLIKRVMDSGAHGIIVPNINSRSEAEKAVAAVYYPPRGNRGVGLARAQGYGSDFAGYCEWLENEAMVVVQLENIAALQDIEGILSVEGVDAYLIGPYDLSASMGLRGQLQHPKILEVIQEIYEGGLRAQKPGGLHIVEPDLVQLRQRVDQGFRFMAYSVDMRFLDVACRSAMATLKEIKG